MLEEVIFLMSIIIVDIDIEFNSKNTRIRYLESKFYVRIILKFQFDIILEFHYFFNLNLYLGISLKI